MAAAPFFPLFWPQSLEIFLAPPFLLRTLHTQSTGNSTENPTTSHHLSQPSPGRPLSCLSLLSFVAHSMAGVNVVKHAYDVIPLLEAHLAPENQMLTLTRPCRTGLLPPTLTAPLRLPPHSTPTTATFSRFPRNHRTRSCPRAFDLLAPPRRLLLPESSPAFPSGLCPACSQLSTCNARHVLCVFAHFCKLQGSRDFLLLTALAPFCFEHHRCLMHVYCTNEYTDGCN